MSIHCRIPIMSRTICPCISSCENNKLALISRWKELEASICADRKQQLMREQHWMDELKPTLNKLRAFLDDPTRKAQERVRRKRNEARRKRYEEENRDRIRARHRLNWKKYYEKNKQVILAKQKVYKKANRTEINRKRAARKAKQKSVEKGQTQLVIYKVDGNVNISLSK